MRTIYWRPPPIGHLKLNVDGAARGNHGPTRGGGILRNHTWSIIFAFSHYYDVQTNTAVEAMAIHDGLLLCEEHKLHGIVLESDSRVLVEMLRAGTCSHWQLKSTWMDIMRCRVRISTITHQLRKGNQTADVLATHAVCTRLRSVFTSLQDMPVEARGRHRLE
ncbi:unnamed protein product [Spirodela intermedia]|uniref:RNase H type-1 domain-containing protein n=2 Tax=Spirodela intermedia TaxID=51605 RepID=A0A7I8KIW4_SPIIN|nr:unnamed protein product [Spirodela intermedia]CAA6660791.1 unnamed protein product [Spirodela intermedia]CAA7397144.1 unnamed protein product [Spirodela intermedia]